MASGIVPRISIGTALLAPISTLLIGFVGTDWTIQSPAEALLLVYIVSPYALLGLLAWWQQPNRGRSWFILMAILAIAAFGLWGFGLSCYRHQTNENWRKAMDLTAPDTSGRSVDRFGCGAVARCNLRQDWPSDANSRSVTGCPS